MVQARDGAPTGDAMRRMTMLAALAAGFVAFAALADALTPAQGAAAP